MSIPEPTPSSDEDKAHKREEAVRVINEKISELTQIVDKVKGDKAVDKNTALGLEQICPGIITDEMSVNGFTQQPSRTGYEVVVKCVENKIKTLGDEKIGIILEDEPFEKAEASYQALQNVSDAVDVATEALASLESYRGTAANVDVLLSARMQLERAAKGLNVSIESLMPPVYSFEGAVITQETFISMEAGILDAIKNAMNKFWEWVKGIFDQILKWFGASDPKKRLEGIDAFMAEFKGDDSTFEVELSDAEMKRLTIGGKLAPDTIKPLEDFEKLAKFMGTAVPDSAKSTAEYFDTLYKWVSDNETSITKQSLEDQALRLLVQSAMKYPELTKFFDNVKNFSSVVSEDKDSVVMHYLGDFTVVAHAKKTGEARVLDKFSTGTDKAEIKGGKHKLRASDTEKIGQLLTKILAAGWDNKVTKSLEDSKKTILTIESKYKTTRSKFEKDKPDVYNALAATDKRAVTYVLSLVQTHAQTLRHMEAMEKFIIGLYKKGKKGESKKEEKPEEKKP